MGLHYPFGYVGHEVTCLRTFINNLDDFCSNCHTNDDVEGDCRKCPVGSLIYKCKDYLENAIESKANGSILAINENRIIVEIKNSIKDIEPRPMFNTNFIFNQDKGKDSLLALRQKLKELSFYKEERVKSYHLKQKYKDAFFEQWKQHLNDSDIFKKK